MDSDAEVMLSLLSRKTATSPAPGFIIGSTFFEMQAVANSATITTLQADVQICIKYSAADLAAVEGDTYCLRLAFCNEDTLQWEVVPIVVDTAAGNICITTNHVSKWIVLAELPLGMPLWFWPIVGLLATLLVLLVAVIFRRVLKRPAV